MPKWNTHKKWAKRFLEWGENTTHGENWSELINFPKEKNFIISNHDFNRRTWRKNENRAYIYNIFGKKGIKIMDLHYSLDFLKEETSPQIIKQKWKATHPLKKGKPSIEFYPSITTLAKYLADKTKKLNMDKKTFKYIIVNFREILYDTISEHNYDPKKLKKWNSYNFNNMIKELDQIRT